VVFGMWESWDMLVLLVELDKMSGFCHVCDVLVFFFFFVELEMILFFLLYHCFVCRVGKDCAL